VKSFLNKETVDKDIPANFTTLFNDNTEKRILSESFHKCLFINDRNRIAVEIIRKIVKNISTNFILHWISHKRKVKWSEWMIEKGKGKLKLFFSLFLSNFG
jgi:hypothetical protein